jgi:Flp pilus assembly protein TadD
MSKMYGKWIALSALAVTLAACDVEGQKANAEQKAITLAKAATPVVNTSEFVSTPSPTPKRTNVTYKEAEAVFRKGHYQESKELFAVYVDSQPNNMQGQYMFGLSAWKSGDHKVAEQALMRAVEIDSVNIKVRTNLARVLLEQGRPQDALPHIEKAVELKPESHEVWRVLGNAYADAGRSEDALQAYREAIVRNETDVWSMNNYGLLLIRLGRFEEAVPPLARAVELNPGSPVFQNNLGVALERTDRVGSAREAFRAAINADSTYVKAKTSIERIETRLGEEPGDSADLSALAKSFVDEIQRWRGH